MTVVNTGAGQAIFLGTFADLDAVETGGATEIDNSNPAVISGGGTGSNLVGYTLSGAALDSAIVSTDGQLDDVDDDGNISDDGSGDLVFGSENDIAIVIGLRIVDGAGTITNTTVVALQNTAGELYVFDLLDRLGGNIQSVEVTGVGDTSGSAPVSGFQSGGNYYVDDMTVVCFTAGTSIQTEHIPKKVEALEVGDMVQTLDHGFQPIRMIEHSHVSHTQLQRNPKLRPIRIMAGALGRGLPREDLSVSRQHRMLVSSKIVSRMFGEEMVLAPAISLIGLTGVFVDNHADSVDYFHLIFDDHEVVFANGAPSESFFPGPQAIGTLGHDAKAELLTLFPKLSQIGNEPTPAYAIPKRVRLRSLVARHIKNNQPLLQNFAQL